MTKNNIRIDRNVAYNINDVVNDRRYYEQSIEMIFFFAYLVQTTEGTLFPDSEGVEYAVKASDFIAFTNRSKAAVYANVPDWSFTVNIIGTDDRLELSNVFEYVLYNFKWKPLPLSLVYTNQIKQEKRVNIGETIISSLQVGYTKKKNVKERTFYVTLNEFFVKSLLKEFLTINPKVLPKIRGNRTNSFYSVWLFLLTKENDQRRYKTTSIVATYFEMKKACNVNITSGHESKIISNTVAKCVKYLNVLKTEAEMDFDFVVQNNNFILTFNKLNRNIDGDKQSLILISNILNTSVAWCISKKLPKEATLLHNAEKMELIDHLFKTLFTFKGSRYNQGTEFEKSLDWYAKHIGMILLVDPGYIKSYYYTEIASE